MVIVMTLVERLEFARAQLACTRSGLAAMFRQDAARPAENEVQAQLRQDAIQRQHAEIARWAAEVQSAEQRAQWQPRSSAEKARQTGAEAMRILERRYVP